MARGSKEVKPLFDDSSKDETKPKEKLIVNEEAQKSDHQPLTLTQKTPANDRKKKKAVVPSNLTKYQKQPKYKTHVPHNIRIPKEMREDLEKIAKKLKVPLGKNTGFFQEFTIDALRPSIEKAKKDLDIED